MEKLTRRDVLVATAAGGLMTAAGTAQAATFGNPDEPAQGAINTLNNPSSTTVIGPNNPAISGQFPTAMSPPATDVGYVKRQQGHYLRNTGFNDLVYLEVFRSSYFADVSLTEWLTHTPRAMVAQTLKVDPEAIGRFPQGQAGDPARLTRQPLASRLPRRRILGGIEEDERRARLRLGAVHGDVS